MHQGGVVPYGPQVGTFSDGAISAKIYASGSGAWGYTAVVLDEDVPVAEISVMAILDKLDDLGIVSESEYLALASSARKSSAPRALVSSSTAGACRAGHRSAGDPAEDVGEPSLGIDVVELGR